MNTTTRRVKPIPPKPEFAGIVREEEPWALEPEEKFSGRINSGFERLLLQAGLRGEAGTVLYFCMLAALAVGGVCWVVWENPLLAAVGVLLGALLPVAVVLGMRARRQRQLLEQLPGAIDELARAAKTGRSLEQCLRVVAQDTPAPFGDELKECVHRLDLGLGISEAFQELPDRTGLVAARLLVTTLSVHEQTGGDLVKVLERLAHTLRDRLMFMGRVRSATIGSRATAVLMLILPLFIVAFFSIRDPNYLSDLVATRWGVRILVAAVLLELVGSVWVWRILSKTLRV